MDYTDIKYKKIYNYGMYVAFHPKTGKVIAEAMKMGSDIGLIAMAEATGEEYIIHKFEKLKDDIQSSGSKMNPMNWFNK